MHTDRLFDGLNVEARIGKIPFHKDDASVQDRFSSLTTFTDYKIRYATMKSKSLFLEDGSPGVILQYVLRRCYADAAIPCFKDNLCAYSAPADAFGYPPHLIMRLALQCLESTEAINASP